MSARWLLTFLLTLATTLLSAAEAVFSNDGKRVWMVAPGEGQVAYLDIGEREKTAAGDRVVDIVKAGGPRNINGLALSKKGHLLLAAPDAVWALDTAALKAVRVAALPEKFRASDLAYQETTGAILVWGWFVREDHTVDRFAVWRIGKGESTAKPVYAAGVGSFETAAFDSAGRVFFGAGHDLWGGDLTETEHQAAGEFDWQLRAFRLAALGTPVSGEAPNAGQRIAALAAGGGRLVVTLGGDEGSTILSLPAPALPRYEQDALLNRVIDLKARWAFQQKVIASAQFLTAANVLPRNPIVAVSADGARVVYQTAGEGVRRWWLLEKAPKPRLLSEESD
jgi:hypothetical protein